VGQNIADVQLLPVEVDRSNKSVLVATKIEHEVSPDFVDRVECVAQIGKRLKRTAFNYSVPGLQGTFGFRMHLPELFQEFLADDVHLSILGRWKISQFEIIFKITSRISRQSLASLLLLRSPLSDSSLPA